MAQTNPPFLTGVPELLALRMLSGREMYGYEIVKAMRLVTREAIGFGEGVIDIPAAEAFPLPAPAPATDPCSKPWPFCAPEPA